MATSIPASVAPSATPPGRSGSPPLPSGSTSTDDADRAQLAKVVASYYLKAYQLAGDMSAGVTASAFQDLKWTQARWYVMQAQILEGVGRNDLAAAMVIVRERALHQLKAPV